MLDTIFYFTQFHRFKTTIQFLNRALFFTIFANRCTARAELFYIKITQEFAFTEMI